MAGCGRWLMADADGGGFFLREWGNDELIIIVMVDRVVLCIPFCIGYRSCRFCVVQLAFFFFQICSVGLLRSYVFLQVR